MNNRLLRVFFLSSAVYFTQGIETLPSQGLFYYLKESLKFPPEKIMLISGVITFAWLVKPVIGYIIDNFLNKRAWILISLSCSALLAAVIGSHHLPLGFLIGMLIVSSAWAAFRDVSVDGIMCVEGKQHNATGKIQSVQWISISVATLITGIGGGYIAERWDYATGYLCLIPVYFIAATFAYFYNTSDPLRRETTSKFVQDMKTLFGSRRLMWAGLFVFLYQFAPSFGTPLLFIQKDVFKWSKIWIGTLSTIGTVFAVIGALLYFKFSQKINLKKWLLASVFLGAITTLSYLRYTPTTAVVYDIVYSLLGMFVFLMILDFMARNSVQGLEAASFALLTSLSNLALVSSNMCGAFLLPVIGLQGLIVLSSVTSFLCLFIIPKIVA
jgi:MFS family permease